jgi:hypothetical protein
MHLSCVEINTISKQTETFFHLIYTNWCDQRDFRAYGYFWPKPCTFPQTDLSASGPAGVLSQRVNQVLRDPDLDGDARRIHGDLSWFGQRKALRPAGGSIVFPCT